MSRLKNLFKKKTSTPRPMKVEVFQGLNDKWYYHVVGGNGEITADSQGYSTKSNAVRAARRLHPTLEIIT